TGEIELRLSAQNADGSWRAVLFGPGDFRQRTEDRPAPPRFEQGHTFRFSATLHATVESISEISPRLINVRFDLDGAALYQALYALGHPVQYSYIREPLPLDA